MKKYWRLLCSFFKVSFIADLEYRANLVIKVITDVIWYVAQLSFFEVLFKHSDHLAGWSIESMRVFMGVLFMADSLWMLLFHESMDQMSEKVRRGDLDLLLAKPVNSQFMMSLQRINTIYLVNFVMTFSWLVWSLHQLPGGFSWWKLLFLIVLMPCSLAIQYGMRFAFAATSIFFTRAENLTYVWYQLYRIGTRPDNLYPPYLRYLILSVIPVGFIASVPATVLLNEPDFRWIAGGIALGLVFFTLSRAYWNYALKSYSSASS
ncbi:MAG: ABC transporter permease [Pseudobdellovibrionaceae bacterium]